MTVESEGSRPISPMHLGQSTRPPPPQTQPSRSPRSPRSAPPASAAAAAVAVRGSTRSHRVGSTLIVSLPLYAVVEGRERTSSLRASSKFSLFPSSDKSPASTKRVTCEPTPTVSNTISFFGRSTLFACLSRNQSLSKVGPDPSRGERGVDGLAEGGHATGEASGTTANRTDHVSATKRNEGLGRASIASASDERSGREKPSISDARSALGASLRWAGDGNDDENDHERMDSSQRRSGGTIRPVEELPPMDWSHNFTVFGDGTSALAIESNSKAPGLNAICDEENDSSSSPSKPVATSPSKLKSPTVPRLKLVTQSPVSPDSRPNAVDPFEFDAVSLSESLNSSCSDAKVATAPSMPRSEHEFLEEAYNAMDVDTISLFAFNFVTNRMVCILSPDIKGLQLPCDKGVLGATFQTGKVSNIAAVEQDTRYFNAIDKDSGYATKSILSAPVFGENEMVIGVLQALNKLSSTSFSKLDEVTFKGFARKARVFVEQYRESLVDKAQLEERSSHMLASLRSPRTMRIEADRSEHKKNTTSGPRSDRAAHLRQSGEWASDTLLVMVVDDSKSTRRVVRQMFETNVKVVVEECEDGMEAVNTFEKYLAVNRSFDVILIDTYMPVMNGPEAARRIFALGYKGLMIGFTGSPDESDKNWDASSGVTVCLEKPIRRQHVQDIIKGETQHIVSGTIL